MEDAGKQKLFIQKIKDSIPPNRSLVNELSDILEVSSDSAYRRIRSETALTIDEIILLCNHYKISFDSFSNLESNAVTFRYQIIKSNRESFRDYLINMKEDMKKIQRADDKKLIYAAVDIPVFHHFRFPELGAFKIFYWLKSVLNAPDLEAAKYNSELLGEEIPELCKEIGEIYTSIPSVEIWTEGILDSILKQIQYFSESGLFESKEQIDTIFENLFQELEFMQKQASFGVKFINEERRCEFEDSFQLYFSDIEVGNNTIFTKTGSVENTYITNHTFKSLITGNASFCNETKEWLKYLVKKSILISGVGEKQRYVYFNVLQEKIKRVKHKLGA